MLAGRQARKDVLENTGLQEVLAWHVLPLLGIKDIGAFASVCTAFRDAAYLRNEPWVSAAADHLSPRQTSLGSKDRSAVQDLLRRRLQARRNISSGQVHSSVQLLSSGFVTNLRFSVCGTLLAAQMSPWQIMVFAVCDCSRLWRKSLASFLGREGSQPAELAPWRPLAWHLDSLHLSVCWPDAATQSVHLRKFDARTGALVAAPSLGIREVSSFPDGVTLGQHPHQLAFSHNGHLLAGNVIVRERHELGLVVFVLDVETFQVRLSTGRLDASSSRNALLSGLIWSGDDAILAAARELVHVQTGATCLLGNSDELQFCARAFNKTGSCLACVQIPQSRYHQTASFIDTAPNAAGAELFRVQDHTVVGFLSANQCVLMRNNSSFTARFTVWDVEQQACQQAIDPRLFYSSGSPQLVLDSFILCTGALTKHDLDEGLFQCSLASGRAKLLLDKISLFCVSPDESMIATVLGYSDGFLSLVKLC